MPVRALVLAAAIALLGGCGGGASPQEVTRDYVTSNDPEKCALLTRELLERQTGRRGAEARRSCEANVARETPPGRLDIVETETIGDRVLVELLVGDAEERVELERRPEGWRISAFPR